MTGYACKAGITARAGMTAAAAVLRVMFTWEGKVKAAGRMTTLRCSFQMLECAASPECV